MLIRDICTFRDVNFITTQFQTIRNKNILVPTNKTIHAGADAWCREETAGEIHVLGNSPDMAIVGNNPMKFTSLPRDMTSKSAIFSACRQKRYWLRRELSNGADRHVLWIMMNPSRADETSNDATTTMTTNISRRHGYDVHGVVNLSAVIEADSTRLTASNGVADLMNERAIRRAVKWIERNRGDIVVAWGASRHLRQREADVLNLIKHHNLLCLGQNANGSPRFPRAIRRDVMLTKFIH